MPTNNDQLAISIIIPCYNEENNLKRGVLQEVLTFLNQQTFSWEVIIANDGSTDNSKNLVLEFTQKHPQFRLLDLPHGGKPAAVWGGIQQAKYPWILFTDMDQSTPITQLIKLLPYFSDYDVVIGSRGISREGYSLIRRIGGPIFLGLRRLVLLPKIHDTQCGFKAFKTQVARHLFPNLEFFKSAQSRPGWQVSAFDVELLFMAQKFGYQIKEVTVDWRNEDISLTKGDAEARYKKESIRMLKEILRVKLNDLRGLYHP
jgi:cellulose synthase/poly-beta-1,6-N-acetylglucosamine synthase-like glycosyltransferase